MVWITGNVGSAPRGIVALGMEVEEKERERRQTRLAPQPGKRRELAALDCCLFRSAQPHYVII